MRIINQDRDFSVEFERSIIEVQGKGLYVGINYKVYCLGAYKNRERAMEVFSEIHNEYQLANNTSFILMPLSLFFHRFILSPSSGMLIKGASQVPEGFAHGQ